ncbi:MAG: Xaa-Pro aminopeptidase, partial [Lewinella sp.]|nr:Xaa-Pro aminopeptidase [Lewinella sp.]
MLRILLSFWLLLSLTSLSAQLPLTLDLQIQGQLRDAWLKERVATILPDLMRREGIDMWILISREYNEDPVLLTMLPRSWLSARRTTMLVIYDTGDTLQTLACARYDVGEVFKKAWDKEAQPDQWARLAEIVAERDPANKENEYSFSGRPAAGIIQPGDLLHVDFGITYLGLNTDTQQNAYVLRPGETAPPDYLV